HAAAAQLESGGPSALVRLHVGGLLRDALRAAVVTVFGLVLAWLARPLLGGVLSVRGAVLLAVAIVATALAAGAAGTLRLVGRGPFRSGDCAKPCAARWARSAIASSGRAGCRSSRVSPWRRSRSAPGGSRSACS